LIRASDFFQRLADMNVKASPKEHDNLCTFLCIDKNF
jgi:hypothetical protein